MPGAAPLRLLAHAKLNLSLRVLAREASGFHRIETLFCALELADDVTVALTAGGMSLDVTFPADHHGERPDLGPMEHNLAYRAAAAFVDATGCDSGIDIRLTKRIPAGAGLGGGSSDAAAVLSALNALHGSRLGDRELLRIGARLGSDVPFFLAGARFALAWGRGERIAPLPPLPAAAVVLAVPPERVSTADAYAALDVRDGPSPAIVLAPASWDDVAQSAHNDFETMTFARHPRVAELRRMLENAGATLARMTGTGSAVFGIFDDVDTAGAAARVLSDAHADVETIVTRTRA